MAGDGITEFAIFRKYQGTMGFFYLAFNLKVCLPLGFYVNVCKDQAMSC